MARKSNNHSGYRAQEVCDRLGISKKTLFKIQALLQNRVAPAGGVS